jgi:hypothetical protein
MWGGMGIVRWEDALASEERLDFGISSLDTPSGYSDRSSIQSNPLVLRGEGGW